MKEEKNNIDFDKLVCQINEEDGFRKESKKLKKYEVYGLLLLVFDAIVMLVNEYQKIPYESYLILFIISLISLYLLMKSQRVI